MQPLGHPGQGGTSALLSPASRLNKGNLLISCEHLPLDSLCS